MSIEKDVFNVTLEANDIFARIAFEKIDAKENEKIILVEGDYDKKLLKDLFDKYEKKVHLIKTDGKHNALSYFKFDNSVYCILDRDFVKNEKNEKIFYTHYADLESDILNAQNIDEIINKENIGKYTEHIKTLETLKKDVYMSKICKWKINNPRYKEKWLKLKTRKDFLSEKLFQEKEMVKQYNYYDYKERTGIHCAKEIFKILICEFKKFRKKNIDYYDFLKLKVSSIPKKYPLIKKIILNKTFNAKK